MTEELDPCAGPSLAHPKNSCWGEVLDRVVANPCVKMPSHAPWTTDESWYCHYAKAIREENTHWWNNRIIRYIQEVSWPLSSGHIFLTLTLTKREFLPTTFLPRRQCSRPFINKELISSESNFSRFCDLRLFLCSILPMLWFSRTDNQLFLNYRVYLSTCWFQKREAPHCISWD